MNKLAVFAGVVLCCIGCTDSGQRVLERSKQALQETDEDGDGVPDSRDQCQTPSRALFPGVQGSPVLFERINPETGCPESVQPKVCLKDRKAPVMRLPPSKTGFWTGLTVSVEDIGAARSLVFETPGSSDLDVDEDCAIADAQYGFVLNIGGKYYNWACPMTPRVRADAAGGIAYREFFIHRNVNPCIFNAAEVGLDEQAFRKDLASGSVELSAMVGVKDGKGNYANLEMATESFSSSVCRVVFKRTAFNTDTSIQTDDCADINACAQGPSVSPAGSPSLTFPSPPAGLPSGAEVRVGAADIEVGHAFTVTANAACPGPLSAFAVARSISVAGRSIPEGKNLPCDVDLASSPAQVVCRLRPAVIRYSPGAGDALEVDLLLAVSQGSHTEIVDFGGPVISPLP